ncbi:alpha/beta fold hydrolase [Jatrophihabitans sp. DSM 45814]
MLHRRSNTGSWQRIALALLAGALILVTVNATTAAASTKHKPRSPKPTVVLVHGAWADSSSWSDVVGKLQHNGYTVDAFPTPLRGLATDTAYLRSYLAAITGPIVLVGHSYGGAVVTDAATGNPNVKALVYIDAFAPDVNENVLTLASANSALANPDPTKVFSFVPSALPPTPTTDLYVLPSLFPSAFANDLPAKEGAILAATQRPITFGALTEGSTEPAWKTIPSWYEVGTIDRVIPAAAQLSMAHRAHSHIVEVKTSHLAMISQPKAVDRIIETAAHATA